MAKSSYLQLCNDVIRECAISGGDISAVTSQTGLRNKVVEWVAEADMHIQKLYRDWNFLHTSHSDTTITGNKDYVKPTDLGHWDTSSFFLDYTSDDYVHLDEMDYIVWRNEYGLGTQTNDKPAWVIIKPNKDLILHSPPDAAYTLTADYWQLPTRLSANTDTSSIPEQFEKIIVYRAMMFYAQHEEAGEFLQYANQEYQQALLELKANEAPNHEAINNASETLTVVISH